MAGMVVPARLQQDDPIEDSPAARPGQCRIAHAIGVDGRVPGICRFKQAPDRGEVARRITGTEISPIDESGEFPVLYKDVPCAGICAIGTA